MILPLCGLKLFNSVIRFRKKRFAKLLKMVDIIKKTKNGKVFTCSACNKVHVEFNNLCFNFSRKEYERFRDYFVDLDGDFWECENSESVLNRKIIIPTGHNSMNFIVNITELNELKVLLSNERNFKANLKMVTLSELCQNVSVN